MHGIMQALGGRSIGAQAITLRRGGRGNETVGLTEHHTADEVFVRSTKFPKRRIDASYNVAWDTNADAERFPRHYVPAFTDRETARRVACWLPVIPQMRLERLHDGKDLCSLRIAKASEPTHWRCVYTLHEMQLEDALLIPANTNVGLLLTTDILWEDDAEMLFACRIVE